MPGFITAQMYRTQKMTLFAQPTLGNVAAPLVSNPVWTRDAPLLATLVPSADGSSCDVIATGTALGVVNVTCTALGQTSMSFVVQITIITDFANALAVTVGATVPQ